jgi:DNA-binding MarR family transcriptional regulator
VSPRPRQQLTFDGSVALATAKPRAGAIGKVQRLIEARPWLTCGEIADAVGEPSSRVSMALNKLKHEGCAQQREGEGTSKRSLWAGTSEAGREAREAALPEKHTLVTVEKVSRVMGRAWAQAGALSQQALA